MFENIQDSFKGMFGKIEPGKCRLTMNGGIAVKCSNGYKTYNVEKGTLTNVTNFNLDLGDEMFFILPTNRVKVGDIILVGGRPKCVIDVSDKKSIIVIDYENSEERKIIPERHIFMGSAYYYGKIVSVLGNAFKKGKGMKGVLKLMMMSKLFGGNGNGSGNGMFGGGMGQMLAMSMLFGGGGNDMFEGMFDFGDIDDDSENIVDFLNGGDDDDDEETFPKKKAKKPAKKAKKVEADEEADEE